MFALISGYLALAACGICLAIFSAEQGLDAEPGESCDADVWYDDVYEMNTVLA